MLGLRLLYLLLAGSDTVPNLVQCGGDVHSTDCCLVSSVLHPPQRTSRVNRIGASRIPAPFMGVKNPGLGQRSNFNGCFHKVHAIIYRCWAQPKLLPRPDTGRLPVGRCSLGVSNYYVCTAGLLCRQGRWGR